MPGTADTLSSILNGRGPGRALALLGGLLIAGSALGWLLILVHITSVSSFLGRTLPSGIPLGVAYLGGFAVGGIIAGVGRTMAATESDRGASFVQWVAFFLVLAGLSFGVLRILDGASPAALNPFTLVHGSAGGAHAPGGKGHGHHGGTAAQHADHVVTIRHDPLYGMVFEPESLDISVGQSIKFRNRSPFACPFEAEDGELPLVHRHSPSVLADRSLTITWQHAGVWSFRCRGDYNATMLLSAMP
jgi:plastocyanin